MPEERSSEDATRNAAGIEEGNGDDTGDAGRASGTRPTDEGAVGPGYDALSHAADDDLSPTVSPWGDSHFQRHYAWPGVRSELPDVDQHDRVLLAGCGRGDHVAYFEERGACVVGVDASAEAVRTARDRHPDASFAVGDLTAGLPFESGSFDLVLANLVLSHVPDLEPVLSSFEDVLSPGGGFVAGLVHPTYQRRHWDLDAYAEETSRVVDWGVATLRSYYRPVSTLLESFLDAGFHLEAVSEPTPLPSYADANPERYAAATTDPQVLVVRARAP